MAAQHPLVLAPWPVLAQKRRPGKKEEAKTCTFSFDLGSILSSLHHVNRHLIVTFEEVVWNPRPARFDEIVPARRAISSPNERDVGPTRHC